MSRVLVAADDLTGANACAAGFARHGLRAVTVGLGRELEAVAEFGSRFDVVVATTESRHSPADEAAAAVRDVVRAGWPAELVCCRVDTTLRGNVGVAAAAVLAEVSERAGRRARGLCVPAHPTAGRVTVGGNQLLRGRRLEDTELAHDVRSPMDTSSVVELLERGSGLRAGLVSLDVVTGDADALAARIRELLDSGVDVVVGDALDEDHIGRMTAAAVVAAPDVVWCAIDPGPASLSLAAALGIGGDGADPVVVVSGSATELTQAQLARLVEERDVVVVPPVLDGDHLPDVAATVAALVPAVRDAGRQQVVLLATVLAPDDIRPLTEAESEELPVRLGEVVRQLLAQAPVGGLYTTGGDITTAVVQALGGRGIEVTDEVLPLAVAGSIVGGEHAELPVVTKGGLIGDAGSAVVCVDHLAHAAAQRSRWVRSAQTP